MMVPILSPLNIEPTDILDNQKQLPHSRTSSSDSAKKFRNSSTTTGKDKLTSSPLNQIFQVDHLEKTKNFNSSGSSKPIIAKKNVRFDPGTALLHLCQFAEHDDPDLIQVKMCIAEILARKEENLPDINNIYSPQQWLTPLHVACSHGNVEIARLLLQTAGAAVNITDKEGWTPLHCAAAEGHLDIIRLLGKCQGNSADPNQNRTDWLYVLDGPVDLDPLTDDNETPEDVALEANYDQLISLLQGY